MPVGIERMALYPGKLVVDSLDLAEARGRSRANARDQVMVESRSVTPVWEDAVTMAVNATRKLGSAADFSDVELLIVATESGVDFAKPISTWVHRFCELPPQCRNFELKHACYGATGALKMAASWVEAAARPGKKALVVSSDFTRRNARDEYDFVGGGCAIAMLVGKEPGILAFDLANTGYWTREIYDAYRPTCRIEAVDNETSLFSYLDALEGAFEHYQRLVPETDYQTSFQRHIYHAPFPGMALHAHRMLLGALGVTSKAAVRESFERRVMAGLCLARRLGTAYGSSTFISLMSHLMATDGLSAGDAVSIFSYGSGCQGEFYAGTIGTQAAERIRQLNLEALLGERWPLSVEDYEQVECLRDRQIEKADVVETFASLPGAYESLYRGKELLVLEKIEGYRRTYGWS